MRVNPLLKKTVTKAENLLKRLKADVRNTGSTPIDDHLNRCLECVERVNSMANITHSQKEWAKQRIFKVYFTLQDYRGTERQDDLNRESNLETMSPLIDKAIVETYESRYIGHYASISYNGLVKVSGDDPDHFWDRKLAVKKNPVTELNECEYTFKQTPEEWREEMKKQKEEILCAVNVERK